MYTNKIIVIHTHNNQTERYHTIGNEMHILGMLCATLTYKYYMVYVVNEDFGLFLCYWRYMEENWGLRIHFFFHRKKYDMIFISYVMFRTRPQYGRFVGYYILWNPSYFFRDVLWKFNF